MSARLRGIARDTEAIVAAGSYRASDGREVSLAAAVEAARAGTRMTGPDPVPVPSTEGAPPVGRGVGQGVGHRVGPSVGQGVEPSVEPQVGHRGEPSVGQRVEPSVEQGVGQRVESPVGQGVGRRVESPVGQGVGHWVESPVGQGVGRRVQSSVEPHVGPCLEVTGESSLEAARRLAHAPVAVLNFASARNPGGGYLNGAQAQEEALCRASALYACLLEARGFYDHHRAHRDPFYSDRVIHSPAVPVFRDDRGRLLDEPWTAGFLTAAAPNAGVVLRTAPERAAELPRALAVRAERVLETAAAHGYRRLVLGAWGCGVFRNDPAQVAGAFRTLLGPGGRFERTFQHVVFGVLDRTPGQTVLGAFRRAFQVQP